MILMTTNGIKKKFDNRDVQVVPIVESNLTIQLFLSKGKCQDFTDETRDRNLCI